MTLPYNMLQNPGQFSTAELEDTLLAGYPQATHPGTRAAVLLAAYRSAPEPVRSVVHLYLQRVLEARLKTRALLETPNP